MRAAWHHGWLRRSRRPRLRRGSGDPLRPDRNAPTWCLECGVDTWEILGDFSYIVHAVP